MAVLELQNITKRFGGAAAVDNVSFEVGRGEIVALLGPSGCGKTTTLRMIAGFEWADEGRIFIGDADMALRQPYDRNVGLVFQDYALFPHMSVAQNIAFGMKNRGVPRAEIGRRIGEVLGQVQLPGIAERRPSQLSGGQQQRVALARALVTRPDIMLLDEPLSNLDARLRLQLRREIRTILSTFDCTSIIVTHDQEEAMGLADRIVLMNRGRIEQIDAPHDLYQHPKTLFAADFIGHANWIGGTLARRGVGAGAVETALGSIGVAPGAVADGPVTLCIRPERLALVDDETGVDTRLAAVVERHDPIGADLRIWSRLTDGTLVQSLEKNIGRELPAPGSAVILGFRVADCIVLPGARP
ncbi:ABC transporter ATP-binding protein [Ancylobacter dichloromethanicus]|uniref:Spermidine/putrescine import ATP-binding protein PotA n=1 Tax=Ancylobacter dichloromethanicus TaxID=518825 RepID=A0A9W6N1W4_9HYPH|nr:ABC transporter ATP-binding protein [Ancylobacter dichloromethanicus]MBS7553088.1 ABC transporter ATP-binding protein [Ancylobacter dichloromethanicus]GLK74605.1 spermidine/putrescine import ATP-binding protein PotA [Ancylobacter dichloromethanicus]